MGLRNKMKLRTIAKYGAVAGVSFMAGRVVGRALERASYEQQIGNHRTMEYSVERAYDLLDSMDTRVQVLQEYDLDHEIEHLLSAAKKLEQGIKEAETKGNEQVNVQINAEEFAAWIISVLGDNTRDNGTRRQGQGDGE